MNADKLKVIKIIDDSGSLVTVPGVCQISGLALDECQRLLNEIALECKGQLLVNNEGIVSYCFEKNILAGYRQRSFSSALRLRFERAWDVIFYLIKVSFGLLLLFSLLLLVILLAVPVLIMTIISSVLGVFQVSRLGDGNPISGIVSYFEFLASGWQYLFSPGYEKQSDDAGTRNYVLLPDLDNRPSKSFLLDCFSFLFGDGFPNKDFEERKWQAMARLIRHSGGAVIAEQLAPFTAPQGEGEAWALPALVHFDGRPQVADEGAIVYTFENLLLTPPATEPEPESGAAGESKPEPALVTFIEANRWQFTKVPFNSLWKVWMFSTVNFAGYDLLWLFRLEPLLYPYRHLVELLFVFSCAFVVVPTLRYFCILCLNTFIDVENELRRVLAEQVDDADDEMASKLAQRRQFVVQPVSSDGSVVYDSGKDIVEQECEKPLAEAASMRNTEPASLTIAAGVEELPEYIDIAHEKKIREQERLWKEGKL